MCSVRIVDPGPVNQMVVLPIVVRPSRRYILRWRMRRSPMSPKIVRASSVRSTAAPACIPPWGVSARDTSTIATPGARSNPQHDAGPARRAQSAWRARSDGKARLGRRRLLNSSELVPSRDPANFNGPCWSLPPNAFEHADSRPGLRIGDLAWFSGPRTTDYHRPRRSDHHPQTVLRIPLAFRYIPQFSASA